MEGDTWKTFDDVSKTKSTRTRVIVSTWGEGCTRLGDVRSCTGVEEAGVGEKVKEVGV